LVLDTIFDWAVVLTTVGVSQANVVSWVGAAISAQDVTNVALNGVTFAVSETSVVFRVVAITIAQLVSWVAGNTSVSVNEAILSSWVVAYITTKFITTVELVNCY
jgi:hypothetical protein